MGNPLFFFRKGEKTVLKSFVEIVLELAIARGGENQIVVGFVMQCDQMAYKILRYLWEILFKKLIVFFVVRNILKYVSSPKLRIPLNNNITNVET